MHMINKLQLIHKTKSIIILDGKKIALVEKENRYFFSKEKYIFLTYTHRLSFDGFQNSKCFSILFFPIFPFTSLYLVP